MLGNSTPSDVNLATMAAEYRAKFPAKPTLATGEQGLSVNRAGWAYVCAGGSMPNLPRTTDAKLLVAIPKMSIWKADTKKQQWALREPRKQILAYGGGELDLSNETGSFEVNTVNARTGQVTSGETVNAGGTIKLPDTIIWLIKK